MPPKDDPETARPGQWESDELVAAILALAVTYGPDFEITPISQ